MTRLGVNLKENGQPRDAVAASGAKRHIEENNLKVNPVN